MRIVDDFRGGVEGPLLAESSSSTSLHRPDVAIIEGSSRVTSVNEYSRPGPVVEPGALNRRQSN